MQRLAKRPRGSVRAQSHEEVVGGLAGEREYAAMGPPLAQDKRGTGHVRVAGDQRRQVVLAQEVPSHEGEPVSYITVTNSGPLVPESAVTSLFEPFTRLEGRVSNSRGVGLGLSIVTSVVNAHHGHLDAEALPDGGMKISARLPKTTIANATSSA